MIVLEHLPTTAEQAVYMAALQLHIEVCVMNDCSHYSGHLSGVNHIEYYHCLTCIYIVTQV